MFVRMLYGIRDAHKSGIKEEDFSEVTKADAMQLRSFSKCI